ncbi:M24 family metallopeptidase [Cephaloticoccus capnophilus]|uniref:M24 family metallopeptidase n=1 Tax=Cephaloticoccus capnophilus TaxID=1548208 RepID=UPI000B135713|nr:Xaa-Pro peptidase family protein [Cephaloticoccus capnophilus]
MTSPRSSPASEKKSREAATLIYADTATNADQLYFSRVDVHDPFIAFGIGGKRYTVQSALEFGRVKKARSFDEVLALEEWSERAKKAFSARAKNTTSARTRTPVAIGPAEIIATIAKAKRIRRFRVASDFPAALFVKLGALGVEVEIADGPLFPEREIKSPREAAAIREGNRLSSVGFSAVEDILRRTKIRGRELIFEGRPLSSERLHFAIQAAILAEGGRADDTIAAGGDQACDPHERGHGPLRPHELIIVDIFPRVVKTGYFGDMTRTYLKGRASEAQRRLVATVHAAQRAGIAAVREGVDGAHVHGEVLKTFAAAGYETRRGPHGSVGFFHGTGHGVGLAIHEAPRVNSQPYTLKKGSVITVEPGLYYPGLGGCRIEDVVQVGARGAKPLSSHPYDWEIR